MVFGNGKIVAESNDVRGLSTIAYHLQLCTRSPYSPSLIASRLSLRQPQHGRRTASIIRVCMPIESPFSAIFWLTASCAHRVPFGDSMDKLFLKKFIHAEHQSSLTGHKFQTVI